MPVPNHICFSPSFLPFLTLVSSTGPAKGGIVQSLLKLIDAEDNMELQQPTAEQPLTLRTVDFSLVKNGQVESDHFHFKVQHGQ